MNVLALTIFVGLLLVGFFVIPLERDSPSSENDNA